MTRRSRPGVVLIAHCHPDREHHARGLCKQCYGFHKNKGTLEQFGYQRRNLNRPIRQKRKTQEEYLFLKETCGLSNQEIADKLGIKYHSLINSIARWRRLDD